MREVLLLFRVILSPSRWNLDSKFNKTWDKIVRELLEEQASIDMNAPNIAQAGLFGVSPSVVNKLGDIYINLDTSSSYFGCSTYNNKFISSGSGLSRRTRILLQEYMEKDAYSEYKKNHSKLHKAMK